MLTHYCAVFTVKNLVKSLNYYVDLLGFTIIDHYGQPMYYAEVKKDEAQSLMLLENKDFSRPISDVVSLAFYSSHIDRQYQDFNTRGVTILETIENKEYNMREFSIMDPDGYIIVFRQTLQH